MGQKLSTSENLDFSLTKKDDHQKQKKSFHPPDKKALRKSILNFQNDINNGKSNVRLSEDDPRNNSHDDCTILEEEAVKNGTNAFGDNRKSTNGGMSLAFVANPSVAELSQITALTMWRNQVHESSDNNLSEKVFNTISYEDFSAEQHVDIATISKRDSSTYTHESKDLDDTGYRGNKKNSSNDDSNLICKKCKKRKRISRRKEKNRQLYRSYSWLDLPRRSISCIKLISAKQRRSKKTLPPTRKKRVLKQKFMHQKKNFRAVDCDKDIFKLPMRTSHQVGKRKKRVQT